MAITPVKTLVAQAKKHIQTHLQEDADPDKIIAAVNLGHQVFKSIH